MKLAARYADTWNTYAGWNLSPQHATDFLSHHNELLDAFCNEIGRDPNEITRSLMVGLTQDAPFASLQAFHDYIGRMREVGMTEFVFFYDLVGGSKNKFLDRDMLERVATEAIPVIKGKV